MDPCLKGTIDALRKDHDSGASEMLNAVLNAILSIPEGDIITIPIAEWERFALDIHLAKPSIAPVFNVANTILNLLEEDDNGPVLIRNRMLEMLHNEKKSGLRIAEHASRMVEGEWLITTSYSSTVAQVLKALSRVRNIKVSVAEASPGGEGRQFARVLADHGIEAEIICDSTVFARMERADGAISGADSLTPTGLINKVGTHPLAEAAEYFGKGSYAVCGWSKVCPVELSDLIVKQTKLGERLIEHSQVFERTPLPLFSRVITDRGDITIPELQKHMDNIVVARSWSEHGVLWR